MDISRSRAEIWKDCRLIAWSKIPGVVVIGVACLAPLPYGSTEYGWICVWLGILAASVVSRAWSAPLPSNRIPIFTICALGFGLACLVAFQVSTRVPGILIHPAWKTASENGISDVAGRLAIEAVAPVYALGLPFAVLMAFLAGYLYASRRPWCWSLVKALVIAGIIYASLGVFLGVVTPGYVLFERKIAYQNDFTGTFINRNTAADYFGVCFLAAATLAFRELRQNWPTGYLPTKEKLIFLVQNLTSGTTFWSLIAAALLAAVLLTGSRAGAAFSVFGAVVLLFLLIRKMGQANRIALLGAASAAALIVLQLFGTGSILTRVSEGLNENGRYRGWSSALEIIKDQPFFGTGLGTFKIAFPLYRQGERGTMQIWEQAHSTPLELAVELGLPATSILFGLWGLALVSLFRSYLREGDAYALPALGFSVMLLAGLHSLVDFPLQIPGCVIPIAIMLGAIIRISGQNGRAAQFMSPA